MKIDVLTLLAGQAERQIEQVASAVDLAFGLAVYLKSSPDDVPDRTMTFTQEDLKKFVRDFKVVRTVDGEGAWTIQVTRR